MNKPLVIRHLRHSAVIGILVIAVALFSGPGVSSPGGKLSAENAAWARHLDELYTPGNQIEPTTGGESVWLIGPMFPDPKTGIEDHYDTHATGNCLVFMDEQCAKRLAAHGKTLSLPPASLVEVVKRDKPSGSTMIEVRVLRMGKRATTKAERARVWWMVDIDLEDPGTWVNPAR